MGKTLFINITRGFIRRIGIVMIASLPGAVLAADLASVVSQALATDPELREVQHRVSARGEEVVQAQAGFRPSIDFNAGYGYEYTDSPATRGGGQDHVDESRRELGLTLNQLLYDGGVTRGEVERQQSRLDSTQFRVRSTSENRSLTVVAAYLDVLRMRQQLALAQDNLGTHLRIQDQIRLRSEAGVGRRADLEQINARVALAQTNVEAARVNLVDAETTYLRAVGAQPSAELEEPADPTGQWPASLDDAIETAKKSHPLALVAAADIAAAQAQQRSAKGVLHPRVNLEVNGNLNDDIDGIDGHNNDLSAMLRLRYNLYNGGANRARVRETAYQVNEAMEVRDQTLRQIEESLRLAWSARQATERQLGYVRERVDFSVATRDAYKKQFSIGQRTLLDLLNTENEVFQARQALTDTVLDHKLAGFRILEAMGELLAGLGVETPTVE